MLLFWASFRLYLGFSQNCWIKWTTHFKYIFHNKLIYQLAVHFQYSRIPTMTSCIIGHSTFEALKLNGIHRLSKSKLIFNHYYCSKCFKYHDLNAFCTCLTSIFKVKKNASYLIHFFSKKIIPYLSLNIPVNQVSLFLKNKKNMTLA